MAIRFIDSFDHYATADAASKYTATAGSFTISSSFGRFLNGVRIFSNGVSLTKTLDAQQTWFVGAAFSVTTYLNNSMIFALMDSGTLQTELRMDGSGHLFFTRNGTAIGSTGGTAIEPMAVPLRVKKRCPG